MLTMLLLGLLFGDVIIEGNRSLFLFIFFNGENGNVYESILLFFKTFFLIIIIINNFKLIKHKVIKLKFKKND